MIPQILLYNITNEEHKKKIKALVLRLKIRVRLVEKSRYGEPVGHLAGLDIAEAAEDVQFSPDGNGTQDTDDFSDPMLIFCFLPDATLNQLLQGLRKAGIRIPLKAVLTPTNCTWNSRKIYREIAREHEMMHQTQK